MLWDKVYPGLIPPSPVTAVTVPDNRFTLEGHELVIVEVGSTDTDDTTVLHVPDLDLVVAGDVIYNGVHMYLAQGALVGGFGPWREAIDKVEALGPGTSSPVTRTRSSTTTPTADRGDPRSTSTTPTSYCRPRPPRSTSSTPSSSATRPPRADRPVGGRQRALRRSRTPRGGPRQGRALGLVLSPRLWSWAAPVRRAGRSRSWAEPPSVSC